jgi:surface protein
MENFLDLNNAFQSITKFGIQDKNKKENSSLNILSKLKQSEKEDFIIYRIFKDEDDDEMEEEDNENDEHNLGDEEVKIRLFGEEFVKNNKNNCNILINEKEQELTEFFKTKQNEEIIKVRIIFKNEISDMSYMFSNCVELIHLPENMSKWDISKVSNINYMFNACTELIKFPDLSLWNTSGITTMIGVFSNCENITSLPDLSKWDVRKVVDINNIFNGCLNLSSLCDISGWNTSNIINMSYVFNNCK